MITNEYSLELSNVFHTGEVEKGTWYQKLMDSVKTGVILKDVSLEVHSGEVLAVLGSKGSGKRALLEVISRRSQGPTRGEILLNGAPMNLILFQHNCGYVTHKCDLLPSLTVQQTLHYASNLTIGPKVTQYMKRSRVRQVLADLALTHVANRRVDSLTNSEHRRLNIGVQLVRDPVLLLLDEPTWDLDPLNTYLVVSILSNHAKKYNRAVVLTMEKPRSDVFPFLDRVTYLCLGDVVYTGATQFMLDYFRNIGFPCPELENPLMYYLDRRSRERFIESNHQIAALVEKFKMEGGPFRKAATGGQTDPADPLATAQHKVPLSAFGHPSALQVAATLYTRNWATSFNLSVHGVMDIFLRLFLLPILFCLLYLTYAATSPFQSSFVTHNGLVFNMMAFAYFSSIIATVLTYAQHRTRYYQECQEGLYSGPLFYVVYTTYSLPFSFVSTLAASRMAFLLAEGRVSEGDWLRLSCALWASVLLAEHQTTVIMMVVSSRVTAGLTSAFVTIVSLVLGSGNLRSYSGLADWLVYLTYATQSRYLGSYLNHLYFWNSHVNMPYSKAHPCPNSTLFQFGPLDNSTAWLCRFTSGQDFLKERYLRDNDLSVPFLTDPDLSLSICLAFSIGLVILNTLLYLVPLPGLVKAKFRH